MMLHWTVAVMVERREVEFNFASVQTPLGDSCCCFYIAGRLGRGGSTEA